MSQDFYPSLIGGVELRAYDLSQQFINLGHEVYVLTRRLAGLKPQENVNGITIRRFKPIFSPKMAKWIQIDPYSLYESNSFVKEFKPDIIHLHEFLSLSLSPILASKLNKIPVVARLPTNWAVCFLNRQCCDGETICRGYDKKECSQCLSSQALKLYKIRVSSLLIEGLLQTAMGLRRSLLRVVDVFIAPSVTMKDYLMTIGIEQEKIRVIPNGISLKEFDPHINISVDIKKLLKVQNDCKIVLFVGRISQEKGVEYLIGAFPKILKGIPDSVLVIVGDGSEREKLSKLVQQLKLRNRVIFTRHVQKHIIPQLYALADIVVIPSVWPEPFGSVAIEAMAMKKPIVASDVGALSALVTEKVGILVNPGDSESLAQTVIRLLSNKNMTDRMGEAARRHVEKNYTSERMIASILDLYTEITGNRAGLERSLKTK